MFVYGTVIVVSTIVSGVLFARFLQLNILAKVEALPSRGGLVVERWSDNQSREGKFTFYGWGYYFPCNAPLA